jgi:hypothetical protein
MRTLTPSKTYEVLKTSEVLRLSVIADRLITAAKFSDFVIARHEAI